VAIPQVVYDLRANPITFDLCTFLASTSVICKSQSIEKFDLVVVATGFRNVTPREKAYTLEDRVWRLNNLIIPVCRLCTTVRNLTVVAAPSSRLQFGENTFPGGFSLASPSPVDYSPKLVIQLFESTRVAPRIFSPSSKAIERVSAMLGSRNKQLVTLSPRTASFDSVRNSELAQWYELRRRLVESGFEVVVLPDQDDALGLRNTWSYDWPIFEAAAFSPDLRLAIMRIAQNNIVSSGGLGALATYSDIPYIQCNVLNESSHVANADYFERFVGLKVGGQYPWILNGQCFDWEPFDSSRIAAQYFSGVR
jgi:hypothetical protein